MADSRRFKYMREDFGDLPVILKHLTIDLNFVDDRVEAGNLLEMTAVTDWSTLELDADDLEIMAVEWCSGCESLGKGRGPAAVGIRLSS